MRVLREADLRPFSTMRLRGTAAAVFEPENVAEARELCREWAGRGVAPHWAGAGSNTVFGERVERPVASLMRVDGTLEDLGGGRFRAGCSVRVQRLVRFAQDRGYGGIEYLFPLPASVGGCVFMNAGPGRRDGTAVCDVLEEVETMDPATGEVRRERPDRAAFGHRRSPWQAGGGVVLGATFRLAAQSPETTEARIARRLERVRRHQDASRPNCGSVFRVADPVVMRALGWLRLRRGGLAWSGKTPNWIGNSGGGTLGDFKRLVETAQRVHRLLGRRCELEIRVVE